MTTKHIFRCFIEAREFVQNLKLKNKTKYVEWSKTKSRPMDIPSAPARTYKEVWVSWGDWLGTHTVAPQNVVFKKYEDAKRMAISLNLQTRQEWLDWCKTDAKQADIPIYPDNAYPNEWVNWQDWLGSDTRSTRTRIYKSYDDAKAFIHKLKLSTRAEYAAWIRQNPSVRDLPLSPTGVYSNEWINWKDWLGTEKTANRNKKFQSFLAARELVRAKNFMYMKEYVAWAKTSDRPENIPISPAVAYSSEWRGWGDWLGTFNIANTKREFKNFKEARAYVRSLNLIGKEQFSKWAASLDRPKDIPANPTYVYRENWISWSDWLGSYTKWTKKSLVGFIKALYPILPSLEPSELYAILRNNNCLNAIEQLGDDSPLKHLVNSTLHGDLTNSKELLAKIEMLESQVDAKEVIEVNARKNAFDSNDSIVDLEIIPIEDEVEKLPKLSPTQVLENLDHLENVIGISDEETVEFLINKALGRIWGEVLRSNTPELEIKKIQSYSGERYSSAVKKRYLEQYVGATSLPIPQGYAFKKDDELIRPNLMQFLVAYRLLKDYRIGNWSGTGAGKTLGAILGSRVVDAKLTLIIGLNNTILDGRSGWAAEIKNAFPNSNILIKEKHDLIFSDIQPNYLLLNYETFQLNDSKTVVDEIISKHKVDLIVLDEIHSAKSRNKIESKRRNLINYLLQKSSNKNPNLHVLGISATPVVNSLDEAVSLIEMIKGREYAELDTSAKLSNALAIHEQLVINGIRYVPNYAIALREQTLEIDGNTIKEDLHRVAKGQILKVEIELLKVKIPVIVDLCKPGTIIYSQFVEQIFDRLSEAIKAAGYSVARFNGEDKTGIDLFKSGKVDVLIGSSAIGTGVDGLQYVCNRLIIACLPWTSAGYEQLLGRIYRQGSKFAEVEVFIPQVLLANNDDIWSWDRQRLARIKYKKTLADAAVDGVVPEANLASPSLMLAEAKKALDEWIARLYSGEVFELSRKELKVPLPLEAINRGVVRFGDFSMMNQRINSSKSITTHERLLKDPEEFYLYHSLYRKARETWSEIPYEVIAMQLNSRSDWVVGDFGCGEALLSKSIRNKVYSFDHVAINPSVIACDMSSTGLPPEILDVAVFSLSLMGVNWQDYLVEAYRLLKSGGLLKISEPAIKWSDDEYIKLRNGIEGAGFSISGMPKLSAKFVYFDCMKPLYARVQHV